MGGGTAILQSPSDQTFAFDVDQSLLAADAGHTLIHRRFLNRSRAPSSRRKTRRRFRVIDGGMPAPATQDRCGCVRWKMPVARRVHRGGGNVNAYQDDKGFRERLNAAAQAKKAALEKFRVRAGPDDPAVLARDAARQATAAAREARAVEREAAREADAARRAAEAAAGQAEATRHAEEQALLDAEQKATQEAGAAALKAEQKAARDARYAARKKRR
jgi:hypothetical protein